MQSLLFFVSTLFMFGFVTIDTAAAAAVASYAADMHIGSVGREQLQHDFVVISLCVARYEFLEASPPFIIRRGLHQRCPRTLCPLLPLVLLLPVAHCTRLQRCLPYELRKCASVYDHAVVQRAQGELGRDSRHNGSSERSVAS